MRLTDICIERPVFATVLSLALVVFGLIGFNDLQTRYFPEVNYPTAEVSVSYEGASPTLMENDITQNLENALINVHGLERMTSRSSYNSSHVYLTFYDGTNMIKAMGEVRDKVSSSLTFMPTDIDTPVISEGGVATPVLNVGFMDADLKPAEIHSYVTQSVQPLLQKLPGMGAIWLYGASSYAMRIWLNPQKMAALNVTVTDVENTLTNNNISFSGGSIEGPDRRYSLVADTLLTKASQFKDMIIRDTDGNIVRMKDVATVNLGSSSLTPSPMRINGKNAITMEIRPLDTANPITVAKESRKVLEAIRAKLPKGMTMEVTYNQANYLKAAISESFETLLIAIILVVLVVFVFLGSLRASLVPIVTIPVCLIGVFGVMLLLGYSINVMTLLALILAIGLVVDDAIVMLENIHRHVEKGLDPMDAAFKGSKEIGFSIVAMTITLAAVYAPAGFTSGFSAKVFQEFAFTLAGAVLISGFVALTLSPMMCARVLKPSNVVSKLESVVNHIFTNLNFGYRRYLTFALAKRHFVVVLFILIAVLGYFVYSIVPQNFVPKEDIGFFQVNITSPPGSTIPYTDGFMRKFEKIYAKDPGIDNYSSFINSGNAINFIVTKPWQQRKLSTGDIMENVLNKLNQVPGVLVTAEQPDPVSMGNDTGGQAVQIHVMTLTGSYLQLQKTIDKIIQIIRKYPGMTGVKTDLKFDNQVYEIQFKRNAAAAFGVSLQDIADTVSMLFSGKHVTNIEHNGQLYYVKAQMQMKDLATFSSLSKIYVRSSATEAQPVGSTLPPQAVLVPLSNLISMTTAVRQNNLYRYNRMDSAKITASIVPGYGLGEVVNYLNTTLAKSMPKTESYAFGGRIDAFLTSNGVMLKLFGLSVIFIYLVLAAQFESFVDPFIILLTVPLCIVAAIATLYVTGGSLNLYTNIGLITLVGLITKHGILLTQFANQRLKAGDDLINAILNGAEVRLRPILMTTFAMVLGALPLAFATGPGSVSHSQIGWVIVGGMVFGTFFSLVIVPVAYSYLAPLDHRKKRLMKRRETHLTA